MEPGREDPKRVRGEPELSDGEFDEEEEEEEEEEDEEDDDLEEYTSDAENGLQPKHLEKVRKLRDVLGASISEQDCARELKRFEWDLQRAAASLLETDTDPVAWKESPAERERRELQERVTELEN